MQKFKFENFESALYSTSVSMPLRSSSDCLRLDYPITRNKARDRTFTVCASKLWNNLPKTLRNSTSVNAFKKALKHICFQINCSLCLYFYLHVYCVFHFCKCPEPLGMAYQIPGICNVTWSKGMSRMSGMLILSYRLKCMYDPKLSRCTIIHLLHLHSPFMSEHILSQESPHLFDITVYCQYNWTTLTPHSPGIKTTFLLCNISIATQML